MLGKSYYSTSYESNTNVVDAGDSPPSRPARSGQTNDDNNSHNNTPNDDNDDNTHITQVLLSSTSSPQDMRRHAAQLMKNHANNNSGAASAATTTTTQGHSRFTGTKVGFQDDNDNFDDDDVSDDVTQLHSNTATDSKKPSATTTDTTTRATFTPLEIEPPAPKTTNTTFQRTRFWRDSSSHHRPRTHYLTGDSGHFSSDSFHENDDDDDDDEFYEEELLPRYSEARNFAECVITAHDHQQQKQQQQQEQHISRRKRNTMSLFLNKSFRSYSSSSPSSSTNNRGNLLMCFLLMFLLAIIFFILSPQPPAPTAPTTTPSSSSMFAASNLTSDIINATVANETGISVLHIYNNNSNDTINKTDSHTELNLHNTSDNGSSRNSSSSDNNNNNNSNGDNNNSSSSNGDNNNSNGTSNSNNHNDYNESPNIEYIQNQSIRFITALDYLSRHGISQEATLTTIDSPQNKALKWISDVDVLQKEIPDYDYVDYDNNYPNEYDHSYSYHYQEVRFLQRYILAVFFFSTNGDEWYDPLNFMSQQDECAWFSYNYNHPNNNQDETYALGITCNSQLFVRDIFIPENNNLKGTIPSELSYLSSQLQLLSIRNNDITGSLPDELHRLSNLQYLDIGYNDLDSMPIPEYIGDSLTNLKLLSLSGNNFISTIPNNLRKLGPNLITLSLDNNYLQGGLDIFNRYSTDEDSESIFPELKYVYLNDNHFEAALISFDILILQQLVELDLSNNIFRINDNRNNATFPFHLFYHPTLEFLDISNNLLGGNLQLLEELLASLLLERSISQLQFLSLSGNYLTGRLPYNIGNYFRQVKHLDLQNNHFNDVIPDSIRYMTNLQHLNLGYNTFLPGPIPDYLLFNSVVSSGSSSASSLLSSNLRELSLAGTYRTGEIPLADPNTLDILNSNNDNVVINKLKYLDLQRNYLTGSLPLQDLLLNFPNLSYLLLNENEFRDTVSLQQFSEDTADAVTMNLEILTLHNNQNLTFNDADNNDDTDSENGSLFCLYDVDNSNNNNNNNNNKLQLYTLDCEQNLFCTNTRNDDYDQCCPNCCRLDDNDINTDGSGSSSNQCFDNLLQDTILQENDIWGKYNYYTHRNSNSFSPNEILLS